MCFILKGVYNWLLARHTVVIAAVARRYLIHAWKTRISWLRLEAKIKLDFVSKNICFINDIIMYQNSNKIKEYLLQYLVYKFVINGRNYLQNLFNFSVELLGESSNNMGRKCSIIHCKGNYDEKNKTRFFDCHLQKQNLLNDSAG